MKYTVGEEVSIVRPGEYWGKIGQIVRIDEESGRDLDVRIRQVGTLRMNQNEVRRVEHRPETGMDEAIAARERTRARMEGGLPDPPAPPPLPGPPPAATRELESRAELWRALTGLVKAGHALLEKHG